MIFGNGDKERLFLLEQLCFGEDWTRDTFFRELESPLSCCEVSRSGGEICAFALGKLAADEAELYQICVHPDLRRRGIAAELLMRFLGSMKARGAAVCFLEVRSRNAPAIALYKSCGFEQISVRKNYYGDDDAVIMRKNITD